MTRHVKGLRSVRAALATVALVLPLAAVATGGSGTFRMNDPNQGDKTTMTIEYSGDRIRSSTDQADNSYGLVIGDKMYIVMNEGGSPHVVDAAQMYALVKQMNANPGEDFASDLDMQKFVSLESTGKSETVAGVTGEVHRLSYVDREGQTRTEDLVLSKDPRAYGLTSSFMRMMDIAQQTTNVSTDATAQLSARLRSMQAGIVRLGDKMHLIAISGDTPAAERFDLPAEPQALPDLHGLQLPGFGGQGDEQ